MRFGYTIIYVEDVPKTLNFYADVFDFKINFIHESYQYGELDTGDTVLAFASYELVEGQGLPFQKRLSNNESPAFELAFICEDGVDEAFEKAMQNNCQPLISPHDKPWGQRVAYVKDLNGLIIELCTKVNKD